MVELPGIYGNLGSHFEDDSHTILTRAEEASTDKLSFINLALLSLYFRFDPFSSY